MIYSIPYLILTLFYGVMALWFYKKKELRPWNISLCFIVTLIFWGFRGFCFYDWMAYYRVFLQISFQTLSTSINAMEPGFCILMATCKGIYNSYAFFTFTCSAINLVLLTRFLLKHTYNYPLALMVSTVFGGFFLFTDLMRNAIAIFLFINAIDYISEKKPIKYLAIVLLAVSFHYSSLLYIPLYFFARKKMSKRVFAIIFATGIIVYALNISIFSNLTTFILSFISSDLEDKAKYYLEEVSESSKLNFVFLEQIITGCLVIAYMDKLRALRKEANIYINCILLFLGVTFFMHEFTILSVRFSILFAVGYWILWPDLIKCISIRNNKWLFVLFISSYCFLRILGHTSNAMAEYNNILSDPDSFQQRQSMFNKYFTPK